MSKQNVKWQFPLTKKNFYVLGAGIATIALGYLIMSMSVSASDPNSWNNPMATAVAPILLVLGYCGIIPFGIIYRFKDEEIAEVETVVKEESQPKNLEDYFTTKKSF